MTAGREGRQAEQHANTENSLKTSRCSLPIAPQTTSLNLVNSRSSEVKRCSRAGVPAKRADVVDARSCGRPGGCLGTPNSSAVGDRAITSTGRPRVPVDQGQAQRRMRAVRRRPGEHSRRPYDERADSEKVDRVDERRRASPARAACPRLQATWLKVQASIHAGGSGIRLPRLTRLPASIVPTASPPL